MVKVEDTICYIQKYCKDDEPNGFAFRLITIPIEYIRYGKTSTMIYSKGYRPIDADEVEVNTKMLVANTNILLVQEPFLDVADLKERAERWVEMKGWLNEENTERFS